MRSLERGCGQTTRRIESYVNKQRERAEGRGGVWKQGVKLYDATWRRREQTGTEAHQ